MYNVLNISNLCNFTISPEVLYVVVSTWLALHDMNKDCAIIHSNPLCIVASINTQWMNMGLGANITIHLICDSHHLNIRSTFCDDKILSWCVF